MNDAPPVLPWAVVTHAMLVEGFRPPRATSAPIVYVAPETANPYAISPIEHARARDDTSHSQGFLSNEERGRIFRLIVDKRKGREEKEMDTDRGSPPSLLETLQLRVQSLAASVGNGRSDATTAITANNVPGVAGISLETLRRAGLDSTQPISLDLLVDEGITIRELVGDAQISIQALYQVGIVTTLDHLVALDFRLECIKLDEKLFNATDLAGLYRGTYDNLERAGVPVDGVMLVRAHLSYSDLQTLRFSFDLLISPSGDSLRITAPHICDLKLTETQCHALGMTSNMIVLLGVTRLLDVTTRLGWDRTGTRHLFSGDLQNPSSQVPPEASNLDA